MSVQLVTCVCASLAVMPVCRAIDLSIVQLGTFPIPATALDAEGASFDVTGVSGITFESDGVIRMAMDNSDKVLLADISFDGTGEISTFSLGTALTLSASRDYEDLAVACDEPGVIYVCDEQGPGVRAFSTADGSLMETLSIPSVFTNRRANRGFEGMAISPEGSTLWVANEEALTGDGPTATPTNGTTVRLLQMQRTDGVWAAVAQFAYEVDPMHGDFVFGNGQSGLSALVALESGRLLAVERSLALGLQAFQTRIYEVDRSMATDVSGIGALDSAAYTPVTKREIFVGSASNLEGLAVGPELANGGRALVGVVDDGDPLSANELVAFRLSGPCVCERTGDDVVDVADLLAFLAGWFAGSPDAEMTDDCPSVVDIAGLLAFLGCWFAASGGGCP